LGEIAKCDHFGLRLTARQLPETPFFFRENEVFETSFNEVLSESGFALRAGKLLNR